MRSWPIETNPAIEEHLLESVRLNLRMKNVKWKMENRFFDVTYPHSLHVGPALALMTC